MVYNMTNLMSANKKGILWWTYCLVVHRYNKMFVFFLLVFPRLRSVQEQKHKYYNCLLRDHLGDIQVQFIDNGLADIGDNIWNRDCSIKHVKGRFVLLMFMGGGPRVVVSTAALHARVRGSVPGLGGLKETKLFLPHPRVKVSIVGSLRDREVACSASDRQGSNFESCVWRTVSSQSSHHPQEVLLAQFSLYVHKGGLKPDSFHFIFSCSLLFIFLLLSGIQNVFVLEQNKL